MKGTGCRGLYFVLLLALAPRPGVAQEHTGTPRTAVLSQGWLFQPDPLGMGDARHWERPDYDRSGWREVPVPMAWDSYDAAMDGYEGVCWYALKLPAERVIPGAWQRLRFGRVNHHATVWINGVKAAEDSIGYLGFEVAVTPMLQPGKPAWIVVRVMNGTRYDWLPGTPTVEWVQYGGLLQPVELVTTPRVFLEGWSIEATPRGRDGRVSIVALVSNRGDTPFRGRLRVEIDGRAVEASALVKPWLAKQISIEAVLPHARLWSPESPALYVARVSLLEGKGTVDSVSESFGLRSVACEGRQILLNGRPLRIRGVNRYDEFPGRGVTAEEGAIRADLEAVKAAGANLIRVHYPQDPVTLRVADEIGLLFMEEVPLNWWRAAWHPPVPAEYDNDRIIESAELALDRMVTRDRNHPCVIAWSMSNECRTDDSLGVRAMERLLRRAKTLDRTRLVTYVANRAFEKNRAFALADFVAVNLYYGMWDGETAENLADLESRVQEPTRDELMKIARLFPDKPILLSEFGTIGVPGSGGDVRFSEDYQAAYLTAVWRAVAETPEVCGGVVWSWGDYRQRRGFTNDFPAFFGPFGLVRLDRTPKKAQAAMQAIWTSGLHSEPEHSSK